MPDNKYLAKGNYFEQTVPLGMNLTQTLTTVAANKDFIPANTRGASGLITSIGAVPEKIFLLISGVAVNTYAGSNALDCTDASHNQWQVDLDGGGFSDLVNDTSEDGQMKHNDWRCPVEGASHAFALMFDVTDQITDITGKIGIRLENGRAQQDSLVVTIAAFLKILWRL
ncbi:MAG: hypothetical protein N2V75_00665 [Methanophagales archaeon]|nr:hypothetical protein [Methanophagales archaeon]